MIAEDKRPINIERLKLARESRGLNQTELNELAKLPLTTISKVEREELSLSEEALGRIAGVTLYPITFFYEPGQQEPDSIVWRKREKVTQKLMTTVNARINILRLQVESLTCILGLNKRVFPFMVLTDTYRPADVVRDLRKSWALREEPIANLTAVVEAQGIAVATFNFDTDRIDSRVTLTGDNYPLICININHPADRQRFSLAYQLGHLMMHTHTTPSHEQDISREANHFAAELLMPEHRIRQDFEGQAINLPLLAELKKKWGVSMISLLYRADDLGYLTENQKRYLILQFNQLKLRRREPKELALTKEKPQLILSWLAILKKKERLSAQKLAARLHMNSYEFASMFN
jgi:Zn-dependent peptidase ImmA (M78 family)/DNA-binding XRE family transcriptional regulator